MIFRTLHELPVVDYVDIGNKSAKRTYIYDDARQ